MISVLLVLELTIIGAVVGLSHWHYFAAFVIPLALMLVILASHPKVDE